MKNKSSTTLTSIKSNRQIVEVLKSSKKFNLPHTTIWLAKQPNKSEIYYGLLVNKTQFKLSVTRNKVKRQLRAILINSKLQGGIKILLKPNSSFVKKQYSDINKQIIQIVLKYQNGK